jgi:hypothetical protein
MSTDALKALIESGILTDDTKNALSEAWESKLVETREQMRAELREEFARRYDHDKDVMIESLDKMVTESLKAEISDFMEDKRSLAEDRVKFRRTMKESAQKFEKFMTAKLAEEIKEYRSDKKAKKAAVSKLEEFVVRQLSKEINEFASDQRQLIETKVQMIAQAKVKLDEVKTTFVRESANLVKDAISQKLTKELKQLKEDITDARQNMFGRKLFEAFSTEFAATHMNENIEIKKLQKALSAKDAQLTESKKILSKAKVLMESKDVAAKVAQDRAERTNVMNELLSVLNKEKAQVMTQLLENVQTTRLKAAYEKYLPAVLNNTAKVEVKDKKVLNESMSEVTGDKTAKNAGENIVKIDDIKRLAGLKY